jgi:hypothetical protein
MLFGTSAAGLNPSPNGLYSKYGVGHSIIAIPPLFASSFLKKYTGISCEAALYTLVFVVNGALLVALIAYYLLHFFEPKRVWPTVAIIGLATTWWPYTKMDFSEPLIATIVFAGFVLMRFRHPFLGMLLAASALTIRTDAIVIVALLGLWCLAVQPSVRTFVKLILTVLPSLTIVALANYTRYHTLFDQGYADEHFSTPLFIGLDGILFSAGKSIFLFSPPLVLGLLGWNRFRAREATRRDALLFLAIFLAELLVYSRWWDWSSDDAWGVRFVIPGLLLMCIPAIEVIQKHRLLVATVAVLGVCVQVLAVSVGGLDYLMLFHTYHPQRRSSYFSRPIAINLDDIRFRPGYGQIVGNWILVRHLIHIPPRSSPPELVQRNGTTLYDTVAPGVWSHSARWDFIWVRRK